MDWSHYVASNRETTKVYEDTYVTSWELREAGTNVNGIITTEAELVSQGITSDLEKARYIDCANSNKYNITQDIAEIFEVFCQYEYKTQMNGKFVRDYIDDVGNVWTGRKVIFYNRAIKTEEPVVIDYENNLNSISRVSDSSEIYTKLYITPIDSETAHNGYISIANTPVNPLLDDFILNFDYLYDTGSISDYQRNYIKTYELDLRRINEALINLEPSIESLTVDVNNAKAHVESAKKESDASKETLVQYQKLRDNEVGNTSIVKNSSNAYSVVFVQSGGISQAQIRLQGVSTSTIRGYSDYNYTQQLFPSKYPLVTVNKVGSVSTNDQSIYVVLDAYGYPTSLYTSVKHPMLSNGGGIIYLELTYSPRNAYEDICRQLENTISSKAVEVQSLEKKVEDLQNELDTAIEEQEAWLDKKDQLNQKLELILGPALREGYWTPDSYEDPGQSNKSDVRAITSSSWEQSGAKLVFDYKDFEGEEVGYYYKSIDDLSNNRKSYYPYIDISTLYADWYKSDSNIEDLVIHLLNPGFKGVVGESGIASGPHYIIYNSTAWYFNSPQYNKGTTLEIKIKNGSPVLYVNGSQSNVSFSKNVINNATNLTILFEGINSYLGDRLLYNNAGFIFAFITDGASIKPVLLLNDTNIDYSNYENFSYSFVGKTGYNDINTSLVKYTTYEMRYPRIIIYNSNVNYDSDLLTIVPYEHTYPTEEDKVVPLKKYYDYSILIRGGMPHFTMKITNTNHIYNILNHFYRINYQISRANEMLYLDAKTVARDNSAPKYSYDLSVANTPDNIEFLELGQLCYINDHSLGIHAATGYISEVTYKLDYPQDDSIVIKNYKTKFEDLFSTITAASEAMRNNQISYNIAAGSFNPDGTIIGSVLQNSMSNNNIAINYSNTNVSIDDINGITLTNTQPYLNGVYGQVVLQGGGIFLSNAIDASGARIWNTGITPNGINASLLTAGQLDTDLIRIFAGNNVAFQWNGEGIFAYKQNDGSVDLTTYVKYSDKGLQFITGDYTSVDLGWNGLLISTQEGATELTGALGLTIYEGSKNEWGTNHVVRLGKFEDGPEPDYGLRLYKNTFELSPEGEPIYTETLVTTNDGQLWLKDYILVGTEDKDTDGRVNMAGISGVIDAYDQSNNIPISESIRFWAGATFEERRTAPFQVWQDGTLIANNAQVTGDIYANNGWFKGEIQATTGTIGGWVINDDYLSSEDGQTKLYAATTEDETRIIVGKSNEADETYFEVTANGKLRANGAELNGTINATGGQIGNLTVEDINSALGSLDEITVEITSSAGNVTKYNEAFKSTLTATIKRGGLAISQSDYVNYDFDWQCSDDGERWFKLPDSNNSRFVNYDEIHLTQRYVVCYVTEKEVSDGANTTTE